MEGSGKKTTTGALLGILQMGPKSGYEIRKFMEGSTANFWSESFGQIYPTLKKMLDEGLIQEHKADAGDDADGHPSTKRYRVGTKGSRRFAQWMSEAPRPQVPRNELLLKLFFGDLVQPGEMAKLVKQRRVKAAGDLQRYEELKQELEMDYGKRPGKFPHPGLPYWLMTLAYGMTEANMVVAWCDETLRELKKLDSEYKKRSTQKI